MRIRIHGNNKSIIAPLEFELPNLTILTGENGSGKTHLLEALYDKNITEIYNNDKRIENIVYVSFGKLYHNDVQNYCSSEDFNQRVNFYWDFFKTGERFNVGINKILLLTGLPKDQITKEIFSNYVGYMDGPEINSVFSSQLAMIFKGYHIHYTDNKLRKIYYEEGIDSKTKYLDDYEFIQQYGDKPWDFINTILERLELPYRVNNPMGTKREDTFTLKLIDKYSGLTINVDDLSTGEKTIMALAFALYNDFLQGEKVEFLIMDEPDAALHPTMIKVMLEVIKEDIVNKRNIPVIFSSHSPTTVAIAPSRSLYKITRGNKKPEPCDAEDSLKILAYGIPNLRISVDDRRQVFVEHNYDAIYYEGLFNTLKKQHDFITHPLFLPPHKINGSNCSDVISIVKTLRELGNTQIYGLIDWDLTNRTENNIIVFGLEKRYAIENYIFEPHLLGLYLIRKNFVTPSDVGLLEFTSYIEVYKSISPEIIQKITDTVQNNLFGINEEAEKNDSVLNNRWVIKVRSELFFMNGHELEEKIKNTWPRLNSVRGNGGYVLKKDVIDTIINDLPELLSSDVIQTFNRFI